MPCVWRLNRSKNCMVPSSAVQPIFSNFVSISSLSTIPMPSRRRSGGVAPIYASVKRRREKRSKEERRESAMAGLAVKCALNLDIKLELVRQHDTIEDLANKHKCQPKKIRDLLLHYQRTRTNAISPWNAILHEVKEEINDRK